MIILFPGVGEQVSVPITTDPSTIELVRNGSRSNESTSLQAYSSEIQFIEFTLSSTGVYFLIVDGVITAQLIVSRDSLVDCLSQIQGAVMGSWKWDKVESSLTLYDTQGLEIASYDLRDSPNEASRELV